MKKHKIDMEKEKKFVWGQYFTRRNIVEGVIELLLKYKPYEKDIRILEPSSGTKNFVKVLRDKGFNSLIDCEIDKDLTNNPCDFFLYSLKEKFDLLIGNPPFTKYNVKNSYYYPNNYLNREIKPSEYMTKGLTKKEKTQIENAFILKSIKHLKDNDSSVAFVLPISFFIAKKNKEIKEEILKRFSTIIIYQNDKVWFQEPIPCCFAIFTNTEEHKDKVILLYEDGKNVEEILEKDKLLTEELIPKSFLYKKNNQKEGITLSKFLSDKTAKYQRDYKNNNVSGANILEKTKILENENVEDYYLAVVRVGNSSVGKTGLINVKEDILNDMFYVFEFKEEYNKDREMKEKICSLINQNQEHLRNLTFRVGSKSIKKNDIFELKVKI